MSTELTVVQRAAVALGSSQHEARLTELAKASISITGITNAASYEECHRARMALRTVRVEIEKTGKSAREDATKFSKAVIFEEGRLIAIIKPEEERLAGIQKAHDDKIEAELQAKKDAEFRRTAALQARVNALRETTHLMADQTADAIDTKIAEIEAVVVDATFEEFQQQADDAKIAALTKLRDLRAAAVMRAEEAERNRLEREELERNRVAQAARQAELDRQAADQRAESERLAALTRDAEEAARAAQQAETDRRNEEERQRQAAEQRRLDEQKAEQERQAAAAAAVEAARLKAVERAKKKRPTAKAIIEIVAKHFDIEDERAEKWLTEIFSKESA